MGYIDKFFQQGTGAKAIMGYLTTANHATQALAVDAVNAENIQTSGGGAVTLNGVYIPALAADAELDVSADTVGDAAGAVVPDGSSQYFIALASADGTLSLWKAGDAATTGSEVLKIPAFDYTTYVAVGLMKIAASGAAYTCGTTATTGIVTFYQIVGPVLPHYTNIPGYSS